MSWSFHANERHPDVTESEPPTRRAAMRGTDRGSAIQVGRDRILNESKFTKSSLRLVLQPPNPPGRDAERLTEMMRQMALVGEPHRICNLRQRETCVSQHVLGPFDPPLYEIAVRGNTGGLLKSSGKVMYRYPRDSGQRCQINAVA